MQNIISVESPVLALRFKNQWAQLTEQEQNYAYYLSKASWAGAKITWHQLCYEAPALFMIFQAYFQERDLLKLEEAAVAKGVTKEEFKQFCAYAAGVYCNLGNYVSFGQLKFEPECSVEAFKTILKSNPLYGDPDAFYKDVIDELYVQVEVEIFHCEKPFTTLNFPDEGGVTGYFSRNMTKDDLKVVREFLAAHKIDILNTRVFKQHDTGKYVLTIGSINKDLTKKDVEFKGHKFDVNYGEFSVYLEECNYYLKKALNYAANDNQKHMIEKYIESNETGDMEAHKDSQRYWVKDKGPVVESNLGWVEYYIDPENCRAFWEGWVCIVDKQKSEKFQTLVKHSEAIIPLLPWNQGMEKEKFLAPDFTSIDIATFATNTVFLGQNLPNYDDIREHEGFKNVYFGNRMPQATKTSSIQFADQDQQAILAEKSIKSYEVQVGCHELLGHGVGRNIYRNPDGTCPTYTDPITNEEFQSCYEEGETWSTKFGDIASSYEECRADACGLYLQTLEKVYTLFGFTDDQVDDLLWVNTMNHLRKGIIGLPLYNPETKKWGQAHTQGAFVFAMWIYKNQQSKVIDFRLTDDDTDFRIDLDKKLLMGEGRELIKKLLIVLQTYKSSGAQERGLKFYSEYSAVTDFFLKIRAIAIAKKKPRGFCLQENFVRYTDACIEPTSYPENIQGIILSFADRYQFNKKLYKEVMSVWDEHKASLKV